ncbi:MAG: PilZ domain-containing protein [Desulfobacterales bacterium]
MQKKDERRVLERYDNDAPIVYAYQDTDHFFQAVMCNHSNEGMCFKTSEAVDPGSDIYIMMENYSPDTIDADLYEGYFAEVRWCQQLPAHKVPGYHVGVKYYKTVID